MLIDNFSELEKINEEIDRILTHMSSSMPDHEDYQKMMDQLVKLTKIKENIASVSLKAYEAQNHVVETEETHKLKSLELDLKLIEAEKPDHVSKDVMVGIAANLAGIVLILGYERMNVIASKALGFVMKSR